MRSGGVVFFMVFYAGAGEGLWGFCPAKSCISCLKRRFKIPAGQY
jgi:hypothetical protein